MPIYISLLTYTPCREIGAALPQVPLTSSTLFNVLGWQAISLRINNGNCCAPEPFTSKLANFLRIPRYAKISKGASPVGRCFLHTFLPTTHIFFYVVLISVYALSYTKMQLWWWEGLSLCSHHDETLMLGMFTKMQLWWWGIFLFAHIKMWCKEWLAVPHGQLSVIFVYLSSYTMMQLWWWRECPFLLISRWDSDTVRVVLCLRGSIECVDILSCWVFFSV